MKIAICSDIHDNIWKLDSALPMIHDCEALIFCGDFCAPFTLAQMAQGFHGPIHAVFGNNDGDPRLLVTTATRSANVTLHGQFADLRLGDLHFAVNHYPEIARPLARSGDFDIVLYGHDHQLHQEQVDRCLLLNPGEVMGRFGRSTLMTINTHDRSVAVIDIR